jgi:cytochrome c oxidase subunit II
VTVCSATEIPDNSLALALHHRIRFPARTISTALDAVRRHYANLRMQFPFALKHTLRWVAILVATASPVLARSPGSDTNIFSPVTTPGHEIHKLAIVVLSIAAAIWVILMSLLAYVAIRYRAPSGNVEIEPPQVFGSTEIETAWTIIPILIIIVLFLTTAGVLFGLQAAPKPANALDVVVVGHQFWWEFRYPSLGIATANELHVPAVANGNNASTYLKLISADVMHSFWIPRLGGKVDVIPNRVNELWIDPRTPGLYLGQCSQFCGTEHAKMLLRVYVDSPQEFDRWVKGQQQAAVQDSSVAAGREVFETHACMNCHTIRGTAATGRFGPDLTHVMSRKTLASGVIGNTPQDLQHWIADPDSIKTGSLMPAMRLDPQELQEVTAYLSSLQ